MYVIDVQNDFIDFPQKNLTGHPVGDENIGAFAVNNGSNFIKSLTEHIESNIGNYSKIVFSRDFHDKQHCSFSTDGGTFPPHCVIGTYGSGFNPTLKKWLEQAMTQEKYKNKIDIVFKGMHPNKDSFTAVSVKNDDKNYHQKRQIGTKCCGSGMEEKDGDHKTGCGNAFTGSKKLNPEKTDLDPLDDYLFQNTEQTWNDINKDDNFVDYNIPDNGAHYYVCGLAGDFCVRDTAIALSDNGKQVSILHDYTRNAFVPANFPLTSTKYNKQVVYGDGPLKAYHLDHAKENFSNEVKEDSEKGFQYYMFKFNAESQTYTVPKLEELKTATPGDYFHFLTDHRQIIDDYRNKNITMLTKQNAPEIVTVGNKKLRFDALGNLVTSGGRRTRKRSRRQRSKKRSTKKSKKRSSKKQSTKKRSTKK